MAQGLLDVVITGVVITTIVILIKAVDTIPTTRRWLDELDPSRLLDRYPAKARNARPESHVRLIDDELA